MIVLRDKAFGEGFSGTVINNFDTLQNRINQKMASGDTAGADRLTKVLEKAKADQTKNLPVPASTTKNLPAVNTPKPTMPKPNIGRGFKMGTAGKVGLGALGVGLAYGGYKMMTGGKKEKAYSDKEESTSEKVDRVSKKVAKVGGITAGAGLATTASGLAIAASGAKAAAKTEGTKGVKRMLGGGLMGGLGTKATRLGATAAIGAGAVYGANKLINGKKKEKSYSATKKGPKFPPGLHFDARDKNGRPTCIPAYIDENGDTKELTKEIWEKYRPDINKY